MTEDRPTSDPAARTSIVALDGRGVEVLDLEGDPRRAPIVMLHEGLGSVGLWREFPATLARATGRRVVAYSRFGHGRSQRPPRPRTPAFFHEEALEVLPALLAQLKITRPVLVGHSDGASIALIYAAHHQPAAAALLAPHVFVQQITVDAIRDTRTSYVEGHLRRRMQRHHDDPDAAFWGWCDVWLDPAFRDWSLEDEAAAVTVPVLLIQGSEDPYGTLEQLARIEARLPVKAQRLVLPGGHSPHLEHPHEVARAIAELVAAVRAPER
ncbi:MAG: alpha/beta fold hydrolase [Solirubrobacteraceae bacterium]